MSGGPSQDQAHDEAAPSGSMLFIDQNPESFQRDNVRATASHARRWQTTKKHQERKVQAQRQATYARGLVGWQTTVPPTMSTETSPVSNPPGGGPQLYEQDRRRSGENEPMPLQISGGLRTDPFNSLPAPTSPAVQEMVDYYIHVWSPLKSGAFDLAIGCNTQLDLCWPYALQNTMLFNASLAVARVAWCLMRAVSVATDHLVLYHRGISMNSLRELLGVQSHALQVELIFTIGRMLSIAYMSNEPASLQVHLQAFRRIAEPYIASHRDSDLASVIENRLTSWMALQAFRDGWDPLKNRSGGPLSPPAPVSGSASIQHEDSDLPEGLTQFVNWTSLTRPVVNELKAVAGTVSARRGIDENFDHKAVMNALTRHCRSLDTILSRPDLSTLETHFCCGLIALCLQVRQRIIMSGKGKEPMALEASPVEGPAGFQTELAVPSTSHLDAMAQAFLNKRLGDALLSPYHKSCVAWSAIVFGCHLLHSQDPHLRCKGHIMLVSLRESLTVLCPSINGELGWPSLRTEIEQNMDVLWLRDLQEQWEQSWHETMARQQHWEEQGLLKIGAPLAEGPEGNSKVDLIEYMVLREARDALPIVEEPEDVF